MFGEDNLTNLDGVGNRYTNVKCRDGCFAFQGRNRLEEGAGGVLAGRYGYVRLPEGRDL